jgi:hypothetical protein
MSEPDYFPEKERYHQGEPLRIGNQRVLLIDDFFVEDRWNVYREMVGPVKHPSSPVLVGSKPWDFHAYSPCVHYDEEAEIFRMWYQAFDATAFTTQFRTGTWEPERDGYPYFVCYAESEDGIEWSKPSLDGIRYRDWSKNNVVMVGEQKAQAFRVSKTPEGWGQPGKFMMSYKDNVGGNYGALCLAYSDDGIHWRQDPANPVCAGLRDTQHNFIYDEVRDRWLLFTRPVSFAGQHKMTEPDKALGMKGRTAVATGKTPYEFNYPRNIIWPEEDERKFIDAMIVDRCGAHFIGFRTMMERESGQMLNDVYLSFSRDGLTWNRLANEQPFIKRSETEAFDTGQTFSPKNIVEVGEWYYLYYSGTTHGQSTFDDIAGIGLAMLRRDRFVAQRSDSTGGYLLTREFVIEGDNLFVNMKHYTNYGYCGFAAELVTVPKSGMAGPRIIEGYSFDDVDNKPCDHLDAPLTWQGKNVSALRGQSVQVRFWLKDVGIFAIQCS